MKNHRHWIVSGSLVSLCLLGLVPAAGAQQLEIGGVTTSSTSTAKVAQFAFNAPSAGVLTVVVRSTSESDLVLSVSDQDGQPLPEARSDQDLGGDSGAEQLAVTIPRAGAYLVQVEPFGSGDARFNIGASWITFPDLEVPPDPNGSPSNATAIRAGQLPLQESLDGRAGDYWDWFIFTAEQSGTVTVTTRSSDGDLVLEAYEAGEYGEPVERSDQDLQGESGNEALTLIVSAGQKIYFKTKAWDEGAQITYRLQVGFMPD
jgi:hypothetical protein